MFVKKDLELPFNSRKAIIKIIIVIVIVFIIIIVIVLIIIISAIGMFVEKDLEPKPSTAFKLGERGLACHGLRGLAPI